MNGLLRAPGPLGAGTAQTAWAFLWARGPAGRGCRRAEIAHVAPHGVKILFPIGNAFRLAVAKGFRVTAGARFYCDSSVKQPAPPTWPSRSDNSLAHFPNLKSSEALVRVGRSARFMASSLRSAPRPAASSTRAR